MRPDSPLLDRVLHDSNNLGDPPQRGGSMPRAMRAALAACIVEWYAALTVGRMRP